MATIRKTLTIGILFGTTVLLLSSCNHSDRESIPVQDKKEKNTATKNNEMTSAFGVAAPIDSTSIVMYPLTLEDVSGKDEKRLKSYSSDHNNGAHWNIAFYDTRTDSAQLLVSNRVILINAYQKLKDRIVYTITAEDYNGDGKLDHNDPQYLFISDLKGKNFKQITPKNIHVRNFQAIGHSATMLIQTLADSNKDKKFGDGDVVVPMIFDPGKMDVAKETFSTSFKAELNKIFNKLY